MAEDKKVCESCACTHHQVAPMCIILIGLTFLLGQANILKPEAVAVIWPILLIVIGLGKATSSKCKCC